jgi:hypothetical protein
MIGQNKKYNRDLMDDVPVFVKSPNPYELPPKLGFNLLKAVKYAKQNNMNINDIPLSVLKQL